MTFTLDINQIINLIENASEKGAAEYAKLNSPKSDMISQNQAYKKFGEAWVKDLVKNGRVNYTRIGTGGRTSNRNYSYSQLLSILTAEELITGQRVRNKKQITTKKK